MTFASASFDISSSPPYDPVGEDSRSAVRCARPLGWRGVCDPHDTSPIAPSSLELWQLDRLAARLAHAAVQGVLDDERAQHLVLGTAEHVDHEWLCSRVLAAGAAAAKAAGTERGPLADPTLPP